MEEVKSNVESVAVRDARQGFGSQGIGSLRGFLARVGIITSIVLVLLLLWYAVDVLLLVFAGVLLAVFLRGLSDGVSRYARLSEGWSLAAVIITIMLTTSGLVWWLAPSVAAQADELRRTLPESINQAEAWLTQYGWGRQLVERLPTFEEALPDRSDTFSRVTGVFSSTLSALANFVIILFVGIYLAVDSRTYTNGLVRLFPLNRRGRAREVVD